jgi:cytochrome P450
MTSHREADLETLRRDWNNADPLQRKMIEETAQAIRKEGREIRSMREALIKEHRNGNKGNIEDIHDIVRKNDKYKNDYMKKKEYGQRI